jgi:DNA-binding NtrC family response regulator
VKQQEKHQGATVVVVDADILVRMPIAAYLRECGYRVIEAANTEEAMIVLREAELKIDAILTDIESETPGGGFALAKWVRENRPHINVIMAGTPQRAAKEAGELCSEGPHLARPYDHTIVEAYIRRLLSARRKLDPV